MTTIIKILIFCSMFTVGAYALQIETFGDAIATLALLTLTMGVAIYMDRR